MWCCCCTVLCQVVLRCVSVELVVWCCMHEDVCGVVLLWSGSGVVLLCSGKGDHRYGVAWRCGPQSVHWLTPPLAQWPCDRYSPLQLCALCGTSISLQTFANLPFAMVIALAHSLIDSLCRCLSISVFLCLSPYHCGHTTANGLEVLVNLLETDDVKCKIGALQVLKDICVSMSLKRALADAGAVPPLVALLQVW